MSKSGELNTVINSLIYLEQTSTSLSIGRVDQAIREIGANLASSAQSSERQAAVRKAVFSLRKELETIQGGLDERPLFAYAALLDVRRKMNGLDFGALSEFSDLEYWDETKNLLSSLLAQLEESLPDDRVSKTLQLSRLVEAHSLYGPLSAFATALNRLRPKLLWKANGDFLRFWVACRKRLKDADQAPGAQRHEAKQAEMQAIGRSGFGLILGYGCLLQIVVSLLLIPLGITLILLLTSMGARFDGGDLVTPLYFFTTAVVVLGLFVGSGIFRSKRVRELSEVFRRYGFPDDIAEAIRISPFDDFYDEARKLEGEVRDNPAAGPLPKRLIKPTRDELAAMDAHWQRSKSEIQALFKELEL